MDFAEIEYESEEEEEEAEEEEDNCESSGGYWPVAKKIDNLRILQQFVAERDNQQLTERFASWAEKIGDRLEKELLRKLKHY